MATGGNEGDPDICPVCQDNFQTPKFLPCFHTFCGRCIQGVADRHPGGTFPCPSCRKATSLPPGGVKDLQTNFYIKVTKKSGAQDMCKTHNDYKVHFYCVKCDEAICLICKQSGHKSHKIEDDLTSAVSLKKKNLQADQQRLVHALNDVQEGVTSLEEERQSLDEKRKAVEKDIRDRRNAVVAAADQKMKEELKALQSTWRDLDNSIAQAIDQQNGQTKQLLDILQQLNNAITSKTASEVISVAKEMKSGRGSHKAVNVLTSREKRSIFMPILQSSSVSDYVITQMISNYFGTVSKYDDSIRVSTIQMGVTVTALGDSSFDDSFQEPEVMVEPSLFAR